MTQRDERAIAVTGAGVVSPFGFGAELYWRELSRGACGITAFDVFDHARHRTHVAGTVPLSLDEVERDATRANAFAVAAAREAMADAGIDLMRRPERAGVFFGSSTGGLLESEEYFDAVRARKRPRTLRRLRAQQHNAPGDAVARALGVAGPVETISSACTSAAVALYLAVDALRAGEVDVAVAGGSDSLCRVTYAGFNSLRSVDHVPCRPFRADRNGLSLGEGAGVLVLERGTNASARARAHLCGAATTSDAWHMSAPEPAGRGIGSAIRLALADAGIEADDIDFVSSHGTGTPHNDAAEAAALAEVFGARAARVPVVATKAATGHPLGSCGALETIAAMLMLEHGVLAPVPGGGSVDPRLGVDLVLAPRRASLRWALATNLAFGGTNSALVLRRARER